MRKNGLGFDPSNVGAQADAYNVAQTALMLYDGAGSEGGPLFVPARHAVALHVISGRLHRMSERGYNEDLSCPACEGVGTVIPSDGSRISNRQTCQKCAGRGLTTGRREASLLADAQEIAAHYGLAAYHQGDCRGCALYLCDPKDANQASYDNGHAVCRLGR